MIFDKIIKDIKDKIKDLESNKEINELIEKIEFCNNEFKDKNKVLESVLTIIHNQINNLILNSRTLSNSTNTYIINPTINSDSIKNIENQIDKIITYEGYDKNIAIVGANGKGKSFYSLKLNRLFLNNGILISGQKILKIDPFENINFQIDSKVTEVQNKKTIFKEAQTYYLYGSNNDFFILLQKLLIDQFNEANKTRENFKIKKNEELNLTYFEKVKKIWESVIKDRELIIDNYIKVKDKKTSSIYDLNGLSDGEKVILYYCAQVILAPKNGFIIIDEPESYLNFNLINKLWDRLEDERKDCIFIYITHNIDFVSTRTDTLKFWIKEYTHPNQWDIQKIDESQEIPREVYLEILGSKEDILFCEGLSKGSLDIQIYEILFGDKYTIKPLESCRNIIDYTTNINKSNLLNVKIKGLIDNDYRAEEELNSLKEKNIYSLNVSEIENLFFTEEALKMYEKEFGTISSSDLKSWVLDQCKTLIDTLALGYTTGNFNYLMNNEVIEEAKNLELLKSNHETFINKASDFNLVKQVQEQKDKMIKLLDDNVYSDIIRYFNHKKIFNQLPGKIKINRNLLIFRFLKTLKEDNVFRESMKKYFPNELF